MKYERIWHFKICVYESDFLVIIEIQGSIPFLEFNILCMLERQIFC